MAHNQNHTIAIDGKLHLNASHSMLLCRMINVQHFSFAFNCKLSLGLPQKPCSVWQNRERAIRLTDNKRNKQTNQTEEKQAHTNKKKQQPSTNAKYAVWCVSVYDPLSLPLSACFNVYALIKWPYTANSIDFFFGRICTIRGVFLFTLFLRLVTGSHALYGFKCYFMWSGIIRIVSVRQFE